MVLWVERIDSSHLEVHWPGSVLAFAHLLIVMGSTLGLICNIDNDYNEINGIGL
uniref:Uncharacterized protein n=1 Tax=Anguilla anguilla TaxID=7936 RepID=A0A0E9XUQ9_ANGAN